MALSGNAIHTNQLPPRTSFKRARLAGSIRFTRFDNPSHQVILMLIMRNYIIALALALGTFAATAAEKFADISTADLKKAIAEKKVVLLDVNGTASWEKQHIPGALNFETVEAKLSDKLPADKSALVVAYCGNEHCPAYRKGATAAQKLGYTNIKHYAKGIQGWVELGEPTEAGAKK